MKIALFGGLALVSCAAAVWLGRSAYRHYREHRALNQAREFVKQEDMGNALLALKQTLSLNPTNLEALTLMSGMAADANSPVSLVLRYRLASLVPTLSNKFLLASTALRFEKPPFPIATETLAELQSTEQTNVQYHLLISQLALRIGRPADARVHLQQAAQLEPTNKFHQLNIAVLELGAPNRKLGESARKRLEEMADDPVIGRTALSSLVAHSLVTQRLPEAKRQSDALLAKPDAQFVDQLQHLSVLTAMKSSEADEWLNKIKTEAATNTMMTAQTLEWMLKQGEATNALEWLDSLPATAQSVQPLPPIAAESYAIAGDWEGLRKRLLKEKWDELEFLRNVWLARALREQRQIEVSGIYWSNAKAAAEKRLEYCTALARLASQWGWKPEMEEMLQAVVQRYRHQDWAWQELIRQRAIENDSVGLYEIYKSMLRQNPDSIVARNNVAALGLLLKKDLSDCIRLAKEVYESDTNSAFFVSTEAFALHRQRKTEEGIRLMETLPAKELEKPEIALYYVVLLSAAGEADRAAPYFILAEKGAVVPEEKELLDDARSSKAESRKLE